MIERMMFRVIRGDHKEVVLNWDETVSVIESGDWYHVYTAEGVKQQMTALMEGLHEQGDLMLALKVG